MKKISLALALVSLLAIPALAGTKNHQGSSNKGAWVQKVPFLQQGGNGSHNQCHDSNSRPLTSKPITLNDLIGHCHQKPSGAGNGKPQPPVAPTTTIPTRPGLDSGTINVGPLLNTSSGHSQPIKIPPPTVGPAPGGPVKTPPPATGKPFGSHGRVRPAGVSGGVTVTVVPGTQRAPQDVTGVGGSPIDKVITFFAESGEFKHGKYRESRDHRPQPAPGGVTVTNTPGSKR